MKKAILVLLIALFYANPTIAQSDSLTKEIGFSTQFILDYIFRSDGAPVQLMLKKRAGETTWMRYGIDAHLNKIESVDFHRTFQITTALFSPSVGLEKRLNITPKWVLQYGGDLNLSFTHYNYLGNHGNLDSDQWSLRRKDITYGAGMRPFLGISYFISPRLYVSAEASALAYIGRAYTSGTDDSPNQNSKETRKFENTSWRYSFDLRPASAIFVYYRF